MSKGPPSQLLIAGGLVDVYPTSASWDDGHAVGLLCNAGASLRREKYRFVALVPQDCTGGMSGIGCRDHATWQEGDTWHYVVGARGTDIPSMRAKAQAAGATNIAGGEPIFPFALLRDALELARRTGKTQGVLWTPWRSVGVTSAMP